MIRINGLCKRYHNHHGSDWVLKDINLEIPTGVSVGLVGRNGAGKSTLLRLIAGMDAPDRGEIIRDCRVSWPIGLAGGFQGSMTGRQNVKFVARIHGSGQEIHQVIAFVEDFAEIGKAFDEPVNTYSSGMRSRLAFGLSLAFNFDVYLSDEATSVGDRAFKAKATKAFRDRVGQAGLIIVSHSEGILRDLCQAGIYLNEGRALWFDDINIAISAYHKSASIPYLDARQLETLIPGNDNSLVKLTIEKNEWVVFSSLNDGEIEYIFANQIHNLSELGFVDTLKLKLEATLELNLCCVVLFFDDQKQRIGQTVGSSNIITASFPPGTESIRIGFQIQGAGCAQIRKLVFVHDE